MAQKSKGPTVYYNENVSSTSLSVIQLPFLTQGSVLYILPVVINAYTRKCVCGLLSQMLTFEILQCKLEIININI